MRPNPEEMTTSPRIFPSLDPDGTSELLGDIAALAAAAVLEERHDAQPIAGHLCQHRDEEPAVELVECHQPAIGPAPDLALVQ